MTKRTNTMRPAKTQIRLGGSDQSLRFPHEESLQTLQYFQISKKKKKKKKNRLCCIGFNYMYLHYGS